MNDDKAFSIDKTEGDVPNFAIIPSVIYPREDLAFEDEGRIDQINAAGFDDLLPLGLVPFEVQASVSRGNKPDTEGRGAGRGRHRISVYIVDVHALKRSRALRRTSERIKADDEARPDRGHHHAADGSRAGTRRIFAPRALSRSSMRS